MTVEIQEKINLAPYTSWKIGGDADFFCLPKSLDEIKEALIWADEKSVEVTYLGGGSNVLVSDRGVRGLVICFKNFAGIEDVSNETHLRIRCKAGVLKMKAMRRFLKEELSPSLFLSGLPGDVAGGVVMNAGVSESLTPKEFVDIVESFKVLKFENSVWVEKEFKNQDVQWAYRKSSGWGPGVITEVVLAWPLDQKTDNIKKMVKEAQELRASKQPLSEPSCGSVFRNPLDDARNTEKRSAGYLIEHAGLKGYQYGGVEISRKHANFIVNKGGAKALDIHCAIGIAQKKVEHIFGIKLQNEVRYIGDWEGLL
jgi:UDP-N-acetylmuramate dehydrogenase